MKENHTLIDRANFAVQSWPIVALLVLVAAALRFYQLDGQPWLDEVSALRGYRKPFLETLTTFPGFFPNPLYELMAHASLVVFGVSAWAIRLPAALFGVAGVFVFYKLARRCMGPGCGALSCALFAVSYHHIFYSQDARGYTTYLFFALLSTHLLLCLLEQMQWRVAWAYVAVTALGTYAHPFGIFVLAGHMLVALAVAIYRQRSGDREAVSAGNVIGIAALSSVAILALYAPLVRGAISYALAEATAAGHGRQVTSIAPELLEGLRAGFGGWPGLSLACLIGFVGTFDLMRRHPVVLALLVTPVVISAATVLALGAGVHPRYFVLALPVGYLVGARGVMLAVTWVAQKLFRLSPTYLVPVQSSIGLALVLVACTPLLRYYQFPKQDYLGALRELRERAGDDDQVIAAAHAGNAMALYYDPDFPVASNLDELLAVENSGQRVWVMVTLEREMASHRPDLLRHLHSEYERVHVLPGTVGDGAMRIYVRNVEPAKS